MYDYTMAGQSQADREWSMECAGHVARVPSVWEEATSESGALNILLLGPTGVGKSTFINAFLNYLTYETIDEALNEGVKIAIPTKFKIFSNVTKRHQDVQAGDNQLGEESFGGRGESSTHKCKFHVFPFECADGLVKCIRIVDTPGIGDTRGIEEDKDNFRDILSTLSSLPVIHAICIILKPNEARLNVYLEYCMTELFANLHRNASRNVVFCFTNSLQTDFFVGETYSPLRELLDRIKKKSGVDIPLDYDNMFCFDNVPFRFLVAQQNDPSLDIEKSSLESWEKSRSECLRLICHLSNLVPHRVEETLSLDRVKQILENLEEPLGFITSNIEDNMRRVEKHKKKIIESELSIEELKKNLRFRRKIVNVKYLDHSRNVCASERCIDYVETQDGKKIIFKTICHDNCSLSEERNVESQLLNDCPVLGFKKWVCSSINFFGNCKRCECSFSSHVFVKYEVEESEIEEESEEIAKSIADGQGARDIAKALLKEAEAQSRQLQDEKRVIHSITTRFAIFLRMGAITPTNEYVSRYWETQIRLKKAVADSEEETQEIKRMEETLRNHRERVKHSSALLNTGHDSSDATLAEMTLPRIIADIDVLYNLPISGPSFRQAASAVRASTTKNTNAVAVHELQQENMINHSVSYLLKAIKRLWI